MRNAVFRFGSFEIRGSSYELLRAGERVKIERIPMDLLILLVENYGDLVSRDQIIERLWGSGIFLETEHSVNTAINKIRSILHDHPRHPAFIQTVIGKGYRFIAEVEVVEFCSHGPTPPDVALASTSIASIAEAVPQALEERAASPAAYDFAGRAALARARDAATYPPAPATATPGPPAQEHPARTNFPVHGAAASLALVALAGLMGFAGHELKAAPGPTATPPHAVAVLPFSDLSGDSGQNYPVDGITDEVTTLLARSDSLRVISRRSTMPYRGAQESLAQIAAALHVDAVVEGSVMHSGNTIRITAQLLDPKNNQHLWAEVYRDTGEAPAATQDRVAADIAREVALKLTKQALATNDEPFNLRARDFLLRGRSLAVTPAPARVE